MSKYNHKNPVSPDNVYRIKGKRKKYKDVTEIVFSKWPQGAVTLRFVSERYISKTNTFYHILDYVYDEKNNGYLD
jgi:hypothetical protein